MQNSLNFELNKKHLHIWSQIQHWHFNWEYGLVDSLKLGAVQIESFPKLTYKYRYPSAVSSCSWRKIFTFGTIDDASSEFRFAILDPVSIRKTGGGGGGGEGSGARVVVVVVVALVGSRLPPIFTTSLPPNLVAPDPPNRSFVCTYALSWWTYLPSSPEYFPSLVAWYLYVFNQWHWIIWIYFQLKFKWEAKLSPSIIAIRTISAVILCTNQN